MDLSTKASGLVLKNPLMPGSGPLTGNDERMIYLAKQGLGAIVTKTIAPNAADVGRPCIAGEGIYFLILSPGPSIRQIHGLSHTYRTLKKLRIHRSLQVSVTTMMT